LSKKILPGEIGSGEDEIMLERTNEECGSKEEWKKEE
jgi:hypothetical protein